MSLKPVDINKINDEYKCFHGQIGNGVDIPIFRGSRFQKGYGIGSMLSGLFRSALPVIKRGAVSLGKTALRRGLNIAQDAITGKSLKQSVANNLREAGSELIGNLASETLTSSRSKQGISKKRRSQKRSSSKASKKRGAKRQKRDVFG